MFDAGVAAPFFFHVVPFTLYSQPSCRVRTAVIGLQASHVLKLPRRAQKYAEFDSENLPAGAGG